MAFNDFEDVIIKVVKGLPDNYCVSSVYDLLEEKFVDPEMLDKLPGNQQTLRNYIKHLKKIGKIKIEEGVRRYHYVFGSESRIPAKIPLIPYTYIRALEES